MALTICGEEQEAQIGPQRDRGRMAIWELKQGKPGPYPPSSKCALSLTPGMPRATIALGKQGLAREWGVILRQTH